VPEVDGEDLEFTWDLAEIDGETYQIIRVGDAEVWRELGFFDNISRFEDVRELLTRKYGKRFKSLKPTDGSLEWLCGDSAWKLTDLRYT
jgi:hypothetical protein